VRVLVIGAGKMGGAHARAFSTIPEVEVVAIASRGGERAARLAAELGVRHAGPDWRALADRTGPDACVIAVAHELTAAVTAEAIARGLHVLAEKPVAFSAAGVEALAAAAEREGVVAMAAMNRRYYPGVTAAIETVRYHGGVRGVTAFASDPVQPFRAEGRYASAVYDHWMVANTLHVIDLCRLAGGEVARVDGHVRVDAASGEATVVATLAFAGGPLGSFVRHPDAGAPWELRVHGADVEAVLRPLEAGTVRVGRGPARPLPVARAEFAGLKLKAGVREQGLAFVEAVRELGQVTWPGSDLRDHARSVALAEALAALPGETG
jgi:predicted dehydrogenase